MVEASTVQRSVMTSITRRMVRAGAILFFRPLTVVLALQALVMEVTLRNTAFQDEALYLYAGRQIVRQWMGGPAPLEHYAVYFSGYPGVYPVIGGILDMIGGLELARSFSLCCMMGVTALVYSNTRKFFPYPAPILASACYAYLGEVLFLGRLATFDAFCLFLIALAASAACQVRATRAFWLALLIGPLVVLSVLAKYAAMIFIPSVLALLVLSSICFLGWRRMLLRLILAVVSLVISLGVAYHYMDKSAFHAIVGSTTNRAAEIQLPRLELFMHVLQMGGVVYAAALFGLVLVFLHYQRFRLIALVLFGSSWLMPAYHIYKQEAVSLDKHIAYGLFFAMPLAGCAIAWIASDAQRTFSHSTRRGNWLAGLSAVLIVLTLGLHQSKTIYANWANTSDLRNVLLTQIRNGGGRYLIEDIEVTRYDMEDVAQPWQWNGLAYFYYVTSTHQELLGDPALAQAINDRYFALVELSFNYYPAEARFAAERMAASRNYDLVAVVQFQNSYGIGHFYIWRVAAQPGQGNFTSLSQVKT